MTWRPIYSCARFSAFTIALCLSGSALAQTFSGTLDGWSGGAAALMTWEYAGPLVAVGSIGEDGTLQLDLPEAMTSQQPLIELFSFSCIDSLDTGIDENAMFSSIPSALIVKPAEAAEPSGSVVLTTTPERAAALQDQTSDSAGRQYSWYYLKEATTLEGSCRSEVYPDGDMPVEVTSRYALRLEAGWNIVETEMADIETMDNGVAVARERIFRTVDELPAEAKWIYRPDAQ